MALIASVVILLSMPMWYPEGPAKIDNLVVPLTIFPLVWALMFLHACMDTKLIRVAALSCGMSLVGAGLIAAKFNGLIS
ncbi:MAG: hypothetical protein AAF346_01970 [Pseudomonadota bacterium]